MPQKSRQQAHADNVKKQREKDGADEKLVKVLQSLKSHVDIRVRVTRRLRGWLVRCLAALIALAAIRKALPGRAELAMERFEAGDTPEQAAAMAERMVVSACMFLSL